MDAINQITHDSLIRQQNFNQDVLLKRNQSLCKNRPDQVNLLMRETNSLQHQRPVSKYTLILPEIE